MFLFYLLKEPVIYVRIQIDKALKMAEQTSIISTGICIYILMLLIISHCEWLLYLVLLIEWSIKWYEIHQIHSTTLLYTHIV